MVALTKWFAMAMAFGAAVAAPLAGDLDSLDSLNSTIESREPDQHNPTVAALYRGNNNKAVFLTAGFTTLPPALNTAGYLVIQNTVTNGFMNWVAGQAAPLAQFWQGLVAGNNNDFVMSTVRSQNGVIQYMMAIDLHQANANLVDNYIVHPLTAYLQHFGATVRQINGNLNADMLKVEARELEDRTVPPANAKPRPQKCVATPNLNPWEYLNGNPPSYWGANFKLWCD